MSQTTIAIERPDQPDVIALLKSSDAYHAALYPSQSNHLVDVSTLIGDNVRFLVARNSSRTAIGCGAILTAGATSDRSAELKRMWVDPAARGTGLGRKLLAALEATAAIEGATILRLETGINQPVAISLYKAAGYRERGPFGNYSADPLSIFMEKAVPSSSAAGNEFL